MNLDILMTYFGGMAVIVAAVTLMFWQILSAPDRPNYPTSGPIKRTLMFIYMVFLYARGVEILTAVADPVPVLLTDSQIGACVFQAAMFAAFLVDHCRNWLPARTHRNIQRLYGIARCSPRYSATSARASAMLASAASTLEQTSAEAAVLSLARAGVQVAGPNEGPEAFTGSRSTARPGD